MKYDLPYTIENGLGEKIIFKEIIHEPDGDKLIIQGFCHPGGGPAMHIHFKQDECFTVRKGKVGYQCLDGEEKFAAEGETLLFKRGTAHRFWNAGNDELQMDAWVKPADNLIFFLSTLYEAQRISGKGQPERFYAAYLLTRYKKEYDMVGLPAFVKNVLLPVTYTFGKLFGKYKKFKEAPHPVE